MDLMLDEGSVGYFMMGESDGGRYIPWLKMQKKAKGYWHKPKSDTKLLNQ